MNATLNDVVRLKKAIESRFSARLHFHDACGGQYFTIDEPSDELKVFLTEYLAEHKLMILFSENGDSFSVEEMR